MNLSVVISLYNEEANVKILIEEFISFSKHFKSCKEIVLINNGSTDKTGKILDYYSKRYDIIKIFHLPIPSLGKGNGIKRGIKEASGEYLVLLDGDLQQNPNDIPILINLMEKHRFDYILGWRRNRKDNIMRLLLSFFYNSMIKVFFNLPVWDIGGQPRVFKKQYLSNINLVCNKWLIELEVPHKLNKMGLRGGFGRVSHRERKKGKSKINVLQTFSILIDLIKFRLGVYSNV